MAKQKLDKEIRKSLLAAQNMIGAIAKTDSNEAETRRRIERIFESIMGYDVLKHITREHAIHGVGDSEYCDFAIQLNDDESIPSMLVEIKRVGFDLAIKHLKQAASYAINIGCEWVLLTNGKEWRLYHISFGQPPQTKLVESWNLISDELPILAAKFDLISYRNIKKHGLDRLWQKSNILTPHNMLKAILSEESIRLIGRGLKKLTAVSVTPEEIVGAVRHMLNEAAITEMEKLKISLPERQKQRKKIIPKDNKEEKVPSVNPCD